MNKFPVCDSYFCCDSYNARQCQARHNGQNYVFALLTGYHDPPAGVEVISVLSLLYNYADKYLLYLLFI